MSIRNDPATAPALYVKKEDQLIADLYTPIENAKLEIIKRWKNKELRKEVERYLGGVPIIFENAPKIIFFRNVATPDIDFQHAFEIAQAFDQNMVILEYLEDRFCTRSLDKLCIARMRFLVGYDKNGNIVTRKINVIDIKSNDGRQLSDIDTFSGEKLIDFHHRLFRKYGNDIEIYDISEWYKIRGSKTAYKYRALLALCLCHCILIETFWVKSQHEERKLVLNDVIPAFQELHNEFGLKPLIVRLYNDEDDGNIYWECYPEYILREINKP